MENALSINESELTSYLKAFFKHRYNRTHLRNHLMWAKEDLTVPTSTFGIWADGEVILPWILIYEE